MGTASSGKIDEQEPPPKIQPSPSADAADVAHPETGADAANQKNEAEASEAATPNAGTEDSGSSWIPTLSLWSSRTPEVEAPEVQSTSLFEQCVDKTDSAQRAAGEVADSAEEKVDDAERTVWSLSLWPSLGGDQDSAERKVEADASTADTVSSPVISDWVPTLAPDEDITGLLRKGEIEMPEGYLGWWTPCQMELWAGHLLVRSAAETGEPESVLEGTPKAEDQSNSDSPASMVGKDDDEKALQRKDDGKKDKVDKDAPEKDNATKTDNGIRLQLLLDPSSFEQVSLLPDNCFDVHCDQQHYLFRCKADTEAREWAGHIHWAANNAKQHCAEMQWAYVHLNVYDLAQDWRVGLLNRVSQDLLNVGGAFHAGVEVYGREYTFGCGGDFDDEDDMFNNCYPYETGLSQCAPRECDRHTFRQSECLGLTTLAHAEVITLLLHLAHEWPARSYRLLERNCVNFCRVFCERLGCQQFPDWVDSLCRAAAERTVLQPAALPAALPATAESDAAAENSDADAGIATDVAVGAQQQEVYCFWKHPCVLQAQGFMAGLVEYIICECCDRELSRGEAYWHCKPCDFDLCVPCADKRSLCMSRASESASFQHSSYGDQHCFLDLDA